MFSSDNWQEIFNTLRQNKLRGILTALGVFWGIFMLIVILGAGSGLENGVLGKMKGYATNAMFIWGSKTTIPYKGFPPGRRFNFNHSDYLAVIDIPGVEYVAPSKTLGSYRTINNVTYKNKDGAFTVRGNYPAYKHINLMSFIAGRFLNNNDVSQKRKIAVIGQYTKSVLFGEEDAIGKYIKIHGVYFKVVGVFKINGNGDMVNRHESTIFIPLSTFQTAFHFGDQFTTFGITAKKGIAVSTVEARVRKVLAERKDIDANDNLAFGSFDTSVIFNKLSGLFLGIKILVWFVGIGTLLAGVIGVSNIMLIVVQERTKEIGIRKAIGAKPINIISSIMFESLFLTSISGAGGFIIGIIVIETVRRTINLNMFSNPQIPFQVAITASIILIFSGILAGIVPAINAVRVKPVEALRTE